jgi:hypothetical protein
MKQDNFTIKKEIFTMSITLDDKKVDLFKLYDEMAIAYSKDIEDYKAIIETIEVIIAQKQRMLKDVNDKTIRFLKTSLEAMPAKKAPVSKKAEKFNYAGIDMKAPSPGKELPSGQAPIETTQSGTAIEKSKAKTAHVKAQSPKPVRQKKTNGKIKVKKADKPDKSALRSKDNTLKSQDGPLDVSLKKKPKAKSTKGLSDLKCLYHPESPALDKARQLCSSCKWKLITNGLKNFDKDPAVISFLKGETTDIPDLGQSMCPIHPAVPSYNKKTGLCKACQKKAKEIGITDRHLTEEELDLVRNPLS